MAEKRRSSAPAAKLPEIAVFVTRHEGTCAECAAEIFPGDMLRKEKEKVLCLDCADLGHLEYLPSGDPALTRRATKYSGVKVVVLYWSRRRKQYERQGTLVQAAALEQAELECCLDSDVRAARNKERQKKQALLDQKYLQEFSARLQERFPGCPPDTARRISNHACEKYSGRVGRSAAAKALDVKAIELAVQAHVRHEYTEYDKLLARGVDRQEARAMVREDIIDVLEKWSSN